MFLYSKCFSSIACINSLMQKKNKLDTPERQNTGYMCVDPDCIVAALTNKFKTFFLELQDKFHSICSSCFFIEQILGLFVNLRASHSNMCCLFWFAFHLYSNDDKSNAKCVFYFSIWKKKKEIQKKEILHLWFYFKTRIKSFNKINAK